MVSLARAAPGPCGAFLWVDLDPHQSHGLMRGARGAVRLEIPPPPMLHEPLLPSPTPPTLYPFFFNVWLAEFFLGTAAQLQK